MTAAPTWRNIRQSDFYLPIPRPVYIGPTWQKDEQGNWLLPEFTLGWQIAKWIGENLRNDEGEPFRLTAEQTRFLVWWYAVDERGKFTYRQGVLQRIKGWLLSPGAKASGGLGVRILSAQS